MTAAHQRGQAAIIILMIVGFAIAALVFGMATPARDSIEANKKTAAALAKAKEALIGYAASDPNQPGVLPCPDNDNDGSADSPCGVLGATAIGRLPWRTLGLPDLRDGYGECLWYAVSGNFKNSGVSGPAVLNSDSPGTLAVSDSNGTLTFAASTVTAIVFSPGQTLPGQNRAPTGTTVCGGNTTAANYLDTITVGATTFNNATGSGTNSFISAPALVPLAQLNDTLLPITRDALFPVVEMRVARELRLSLQNYFTANQYYPYAAPLPGNTATLGTHRGYVPTGPTPACDPPTPDLSPYLPAWFTANNWQQFMVYAVAPRCTAKIDFNVDITIALLAPPPPCSSGCVNLLLAQVCTLTQAVDAGASNCNNTGGYLRVDGTNNIRAIVLPASYRIGGQNRPCAAMNDCLEMVAGDNENLDADNNYIKPVRSATNNDNLIVVSP